MSPGIAVSLAEWRGQRLCSYPSMVSYLKITFHNTELCSFFHLYLTHMHIRVLKCISLIEECCAEYRLSFMLHSFYSAAPDSSNPFCCIHGQPCLTYISRCTFGTNNPHTNMECILARIVIDRVIHL